jgi:hypothetical protein
MSPRDEAAIADRAEARAFADLFDAAPSGLKSQLGLRVETVAGATALVAPQLPTPMFNRVIGLGFDAPATPAQVERLRALYRTAGSRSWWLHWNPLAAWDGERDAAGAIAALGFTVPARRSWAKMLRSTADAALPACDLKVAQAGSGQVAAATSAVATAFGMPPLIGAWLAELERRPGWRVYAIADADAVIGGACLFIDGDACWLGMGAVLASHRGRGGQLRALAQRVADGAAAGCRWAVTETGEPIGEEVNPSLANIRRSGFRCVASRLNFECNA